MLDKLTTFPSQRKPTQCLKTCKLNDNGYALIRTFEGYSPFMYKDSAGYPTIGYGHLILKGEKFQQPLLPEQAQALLVSDVASKVKDVNKHVVVGLHENQFAGLTVFTYNVGAGALVRSTVLKKVNAQQHQEVPAQLNRYVYAGGIKLKGLERRRRAEGLLYQTVN